MSEITLEDLRTTHLRDYDPFSQSATIEGTLAEFAERREQMPISYSSTGAGMWVLSKYDDISSVLRRNNKGFVSFPNHPYGTNQNGNIKAAIPIEIDGPIHKEFRQALDPLFSPARVAELEAPLREWANKLIDEWIEKGECDFHNGFAISFPGVTVLKIMGWPEDDLFRLFDWVDVIMHGVQDGTEEESNAARAKAHGEIREYFFAMIADRRKNPGSDDVTSAMMAHEFEGKPMTDDELFDFFVLMMLAGLDTVQSVLCRSMIHLAENPEKWDAMFATPDAIGPAVDELLRWATPPIPTRTVVVDEINVGELMLPKGERVHFPLAAGNRDPQYYPNPDEVVLDRYADPKTKPHLAFGLGAHRCVGVHLARLELKIAFEELHRRLPTFSLSSDPAKQPRDHLGMAWGVSNVHLVFEPGPREVI